MTQIGAESRDMRKPQGRLTDIFQLPDDESGQPRTVLMLDQLTHVPEKGDMLRIAGRNLPIAEVSKHRTRSCLTMRKLSGQGSIGLLVNEPSDELTPLVQTPNRLLVTWTPKAELPWHFKTDDLPRFTRLNEDWNAHPNDDGLKIEQKGQTLLARMRPNPYVYRQYENIPWITVHFNGCAKYRITQINDHGWFSGQCRFSGLAPSWGEFYEVSGNTRDDMDPTPWIMKNGNGARHFHFYLRDVTLEIKALDWCMHIER